MEQWTVMVEVDLPPGGLTDEQMMDISQELDQCAVSTTDQVVCAAFCISAGDARSATISGTEKWQASARAIGWPAIRLLSVERDDA